MAPPGAYVMHNFSPTSSVLGDPLQLFPAQPRLRDVCLKITSPGVFGILHMHLNNLPATRSLAHCRSKQHASHQAICALSVQITCQHQATCALSVQTTCQPSGHLCIVGPNNRDIQRMLRIMIIYDTNLLLSHVDL